MQFKNALFLATALTAGSAVARLHGHERRHQQHLEARSVGSWVTATIDGQVVSWINTYSGATSAADANVAAATTAAAAAIVEDVAGAATSSSKTTSATASSTGSATTSTATGFGGVSASTGSGDTYCGNVGVPYNSNFLTITEAELDNYDYTITFDGSSTTEEYTVHVWNKCNEEGAIGSFLSAMTLYSVTVPSGGKSYLAVDTNTDGGFIAIPSSESIPTNSKGQVSGFWGEFDFADTNNDGTSGFDVSLIVAIEAGDTNYPGLKLEAQGIVSYASTDYASAENYYNVSNAAQGGVGGNLPSGPVALTATLNYST